MSQLFFSLLTEIGQAKITNAHATGVPLQITQMAIGDGAGEPVVVTEAVEALVNEVYRGQINTLTQHSVNLNWLIAELVVPSDVGGWTVREIGMFDVDGDLIAYGNYAESYKPVLAQGSAREMVVRQYVETSATADIQLKIDPTVVLATRAWVTDQIKTAERQARARRYFFAQI